MKVQIGDRDALESLTAAVLRAYLEANGWSDAGHWGERPIVIYSKELDARKWEVLVPLRDTASDYAESMAWAVATLAEAEDRSQLDVFGDLTNWSIDRAQPANHGRANKLPPNIWRVGAEKGKYTDSFVAGGYAGAGWIPGTNLIGVTEMKEFSRLFQEDHPDATPKQVAAAAGQIRRFVVSIKPGDYIITPTRDNALQRYGRVESGLYYEQTPNDGCPFPHRRKVDWADRPMKISEFSQSLENALKFGVLTIYEIQQRDEFLTAVGERSVINPFSVVLEEIQKMNAEEFERLVGNFLIKHWDDIPEEFRHRLKLKPGLVPA